MSFILLFNINNKDSGYWGLFYVYTIVYDITIVEYSSFCYIKYITFSS